MANTTAQAHRTTGFSLGVLAHTLVATFKTASARNATYSRTFNELSRLSDRELADIGIARSMIHDIAREEAARL